MRFSGVKDVFVTWTQIKGRRKRERDVRCRRIRSSHRVLQRPNPRDTDRAAQTETRDNRLFIDFILSFDELVRIQWITYEETPTSIFPQKEIHRPAEVGRKDLQADASDASGQASDPFRRSRFRRRRLAAQRKVWICLIGRSEGGRCHRPKGRQCASPWMATGFARV